jgi:hypothetical protein
MDSAQSNMNNRKHPPHPMSFAVSSGYQAAGAHTRFTESSKHTWYTENSENSKNFEHCGHDGHEYADIDSLHRHNSRQKPPHERPCPCPSHIRYRDDSHHPVPMSNRDFETLELDEGHFKDASKKEETVLGAGDVCIESEFDI